MISAKDREILRQLAWKKAEMAASAENDAILKKWKAQEAGHRDDPVIRLLFSGYKHEVIDSRMRCEGEEAREMEHALLSSMTGRELFGDDTPITSSYDIQWKTWVKPFNLQNTISRPKDMKNVLGYHIDPVITDLEEEIDKFRGGSFGVDREWTQREIALAEETFGDILPTRMVMNSLPGGLTSPIVFLMGMEQFYISMFDCPEKVHEVMDMATTVYEQYYDFLEKEKLLLPTVGTSPIDMESFAFNHELPSENVTKTTQCWGFLESQETTAISPEMFGEFVFPYQDRLAKRFGLLSYGCCERVDATWPYISRWKNLRKLSVSPFNNEALVGEYLRGSNVVFYSKPRAEFVTNRGPLDEAAILEYFKGVAEHASGCLFEVAQREVGTLYGDFNRGRRYVELAREAIGQHWKP